ncbi:MAG: thioredoxin family protein [Slackia piriformis]|uniref:Thioredoxin family protein n=1 Tax=Slackia piriformis TaxID=626934 RepID=A0A943V1C9_9ACTN|nr:thioredoxin family protein [Slackia piriformis]
MKLIELDKENFDALVTEADRPVLVEFFSLGCGPCHALATVLEAAADMHSNVRFAAMDTVRFPDVAWAFDVAAAPTTLLFEGGRRIDAVTGYVPRERIEEMLAAVEQEGAR